MLESQIKDHIKFFFISYEFVFIRDRFLLHSCSHDYFQLQFQWFGHFNYFLIIIINCCSRGFDPGYISRDVGFKFWINGIVRCSQGFIFNAIHRLHKMCQQQMIVCITNIHAIYYSFINRIVPKLFCTFCYMRNPIIKVP